MDKFLKRKINKVKRSLKISDLEKAFTLQDEYKIYEEVFKIYKNGEIDQHTEEYKEKLRELNIELPDIAFHKNTPNFVVDITKLPIMILKDYGFIKT